MGLFALLESFKPSNIKQRFTDFLYDSGVKLGLAVNMTDEEIESNLENMPFGRISRPLSQVINSIRTHQTAFGYYSRLQPDEIPSTNAFDKVDWLTDKYGYVVEYDVYDQNGNFVGLQTSRLDTDEIYTQEELLGLVRESFVTSSGVNLADFDNLRIKGALTKLQ